MKQRFFKILAAVCALVLLISMSSISGVFADSSEELQQLPLADVMATNQGKTSFMVSAGIGEFTPPDSDTDVNVGWDEIFPDNEDGDHDVNVDFGDIFDVNTTVDFYISFPKEGGFRLRLSELDKNSGFFNPSEVLPITYVTLDDGIVKMSAEGGADDTVLYFKAVEGGFTLSVADGNKEPVLTLDSTTSFKLWFDSAYKVRKCQIDTPLQADEAIYGGGERFNAFNLSGSTFALNNMDAAYNDSDAISSTAHTNSYLNVPVFHSSEGYSIWYNMTYVATADVGKSDANVMSLNFEGEKLDFYVFPGKIQDNIKKYTSITGTSVVPPQWAFDYWIGGKGSAWQKNDTLTDAEELVEQLKGYTNKYGITIGTVYAEENNTYTSAFTDLVKEEYPEYANVKLLTWYGGRAAADLDDAWNGDIGDWFEWYKNWANLPTVVAYENYPYPKKASDLSTFLFTGGDISGVSAVDFSHPNATNALIGLLADKYSWGVRGAMVDFGEQYPLEDSLAYNGLYGDEMHNLNAYYYAKASKEAFDALQRGNQQNTPVDADYILFARSGAAGSQKYAGNFLGDQKTSWVGLTDQLNALLSMGASGFNIYGGDLGGHTGAPGTNLYHRWLQLSAFSPLMRVHDGYGAQKNPWDFGQIAEEAFQSYYWLRQNLQDALYSASVDANLNGTSFVQGLGIAYQGQAGVKTVGDQYLFANNILVSPVTADNTWYRDVRFPEGTWYNLWNGDRVDGDRKVTVDAPMGMIPAYLKSGAVIPVDLPASMKIMTRMGETRYKGLLVTPPDNLTNSTVYTADDGFESITYTSKYVSDRQFVLKAGTDCSVKNLVAYGVDAVSVTVDGVAIQEGAMPTADATYANGCFYTDNMGHTYIVLPSSISSWKEIAITEKENYRQQIVLNTPSDGVYSYGNMVDTDSNKIQSADDFLSRYRSNKVTVELSAGAQWVDYIDIGWADTTADTDGSYKVKVTLSNGSTEYVDEAGKRGTLYRVQVGKTIKSFTIESTGYDDSSIDGTGKNTTAKIYDIRAYGAPTTQFENGSVSVNTTNKTITVTPADGYQLRAGSLRAMKTDGTLVALTRVGSPYTGSYNASGCDVFKYDTTEEITVSAQFYQPNKTVLNSGAVATQVNPSKSGLRFIYRLNRTVDSDGKIYIAVRDDSTGKLKNVEIVDYGILFGVDSLVGNQTLTVDMAGSSQYIQKLSVLQTNKYIDFCDEYVDYSIQITGLNTAWKAADITANAYVQLADGTYLYANGYTTNYNEAAQ